MKKIYLSLLYTILLLSFLASKSLAQEGETSTNVFPNGLKIGLHIEQLGVNSLGINGSYKLPFNENMEAGLSLSTNRLWLLFLPNQLPVDYVTANVKYSFKNKTIFEPFVGLKGRFAKVNLDNKSFNELSELNTNNFSLGLNFGSNLYLGTNYLLYLDITGNYPASFAIPFVTTQFGFNYVF